jgi:hypothetical protein
MPNYATCWRITIPLPAYGQVRPLKGSIQLDLRSGLLSGRLLPITRLAHNGDACDGLPGRGEKPIGAMNGLA